VGFKNGNIFPGELEFGCVVGEAWLETRAAFEFVARIDATHQIMRTRIYSKLRGKVAVVGGSGKDEYAFPLARSICSPTSGFS